VVWFTKTLLLKFSLYKDRYTNGEKQDVLEQGFTASLFGDITT